MPKLSSRSIVYAIMGALSCGFIAFVSTSRSVLSMVIACSVIGLIIGYKAFLMHSVSAATKDFLADRLGIDFLLYFLFVIGPGRLFLRDLGVPDDSIFPIQIIVVLLLGVVSFSGRAETFNEVDRALGHNQDSGAQTRSGPK